MADSENRHLLIEEMMTPKADGVSPIVTMMKDQYANYVIQKLLDISNDRHQEILLNIIRDHIDALKKYTFGKHIVARFEQLVSPGE